MGGAIVSPQTPVLTGFLPWYLTVFRQFTFMPNFGEIIAENIMKLWGKVFDWNVKELDFEIN